MIRTIVIVACIAGGATAHADINHNFAGSAQLDYFSLPGEANPRAIAFSGYTVETSLKLAADFSKHVSANVKVCFGCHGFELSMAYFDIRVADELNVRVGRFIPAFGDFPLRHDVANHRTNDKPLPYDMGRMPHLLDWNLGVLPAPYVDNGVEVDGTHWFGERVQLDYAVYAVGGLRGSNQGVDLDFVQSRSLEYVDSNSSPAVGGRVAIGATLGSDIVVTAGGSAMHGTYDPSSKLTYTILGTDLLVRAGQLTLRGEYLIRRTQIGLGLHPELELRYGPVAGAYSDFTVKDGFYVEAERPLFGPFEAVLRYDGLRRRGNVLATSELRADSSVRRGTAGVNLVLDKGVRLKLSGELYRFSDFGNEVAIHTAVVGSF